MLLKNQALEGRTPRLWIVPVTIAALVLLAAAAAVSLVPRALAEEKPAIGEAAAKPADEVSPASDKSATKEGSKTEPKPAPTHSLTAEPNPDQAKAIAGWHMLGKTELAIIEVEKALYVAANGIDFFIHVRVTNATDRAVGVDLKGNWQYTAVYPKMWLKLDTDRRGVIREMRIQHDTLDEHARARLQADFAAGKLTTIPAGKSVDYYREFLFNGSRADVDKAAGKYLIISLDGEQLLTDGAKVEQFTLEWRGDVDHTRTDLVIPSPVPWHTIPAHGRIVPQG